MSIEAQMAKLRVDNETPEEKFKRIATLRTQRLLEDLRLLGNCSNVGLYEYTEEDVNKIFSTIDKEMKRVRSLFSKPPTDFSLK
jgi:hypothetical protein